MENNVAAAIRNTSAEYMASILRMRNPGPESLGSFFMSAQSVASLASLAWVPYSHPDVAAPAVAYRTEQCGGTFGLMEIESIGQRHLRLIASRKGTGFMEITVKVPRADALKSLQKVEFLVALVGPGKDGQPILWTVFPGEPIAPSVLKVEDATERDISPEEAAALGFKWAKVELA